MERSPPLRRSRSDVGAALLGLCIAFACACAGRPQATSTPSPAGLPCSQRPDIREKTHGYTPEEQSIVQRARAIVKERGIDVSGLQESLSLFMSTWYVGYDAPEQRGPGGGGWYVSFDCATGEFLRTGKNQ